MQPSLGDFTGLVALIVSAYVAWTQRKKPDADISSATAALVEPMRRRLEDLDSRLRVAEDDNSKLKLELQTKDTLIRSLERQVSNQGKEMLNMALQMKSMGDEIESARQREYELVEGVATLCTQLEELGHEPRYRPRGRSAKKT